jgi:hypothetical protein
MTWKAMSAERACDLVDFWAAADWPLTAEQVQQLGVQVGWQPDGDEMMKNTADGLSEPSVGIVTLPDGETASISYWATDVVRDPDARGDAFLDDQYALIVAEGQRRWGSAALSSGERASALWELAGGSRVVVGRGTRSVVVDFTTPQYAQVLRELGE